MTRAGATPGDVWMSLVSEVADEERVAQLAATLAGSVRPGELVVLEGPLGAGKTAFVRHLASALEVTDPVRSPSFTIANIYQGRLRVHHLDLFRLDAVADEDTLDLEGYVTPDALTVVEWPDAGQARLGRPDWRIRLDHVDLTHRRVQIDAWGRERGERWRDSVGSTR